MIELVITYGIWIAFALLSGYGEAYYFSAVYNKVVKRIKHDHKILTFIRGIAAVTLLYFTLGISWAALLIDVALMSMFSWFHNGVYYTMRDILDNVYEWRWRAHSTTSTARFDFNYNQRCWLLWFSFLLTLIYFAI